MRLTMWIALGLAIAMVGCGGNSPKGNRPAKVVSTEVEKSTSDLVNGTKGEIVKPAVRPETPPSPEAEAVAKLDTAGQIAELGKPQAREIAAKFLAAKGADVVPELVKALGHEDWQVRAGAVFTLGRLGPAAAPALPDLKKLHESEANDTVKDSIPYVIDAIEGK